jgi:hypothetical protein
MVPTLCWVQSDEADHHHSDSQVKTSLVPLSLLSLPHPILETSKSCQQDGRGTELPGEGRENTKLTSPFP